MNFIEEQIISAAALPSVNASKETEYFFTHFGEEFKRHSTCSIKAGHHYGEGGLIKHTKEVIDLCMVNGIYMSQIHSVNLRVLFTSALYHDLGKLWDYDEEHNGTNHRRQIHHISRSAIEWEKAGDKLGLDERYVQDVTHCILSHHGQREWGSPVAPFSREAWILHLCDSLSARCDDCDRIDMVNCRKVK